MLKDRTLTSSNTGNLVLSGAEDGLCLSRPCVKSTVFSREMYVTAFPSGKAENDSTISSIIEIDLVPI